MSGGGVRAGSDQEAIDEIIAASIRMREALGTPAEASEARAYLACCERWPGFSSFSEERFVLWSPPLEEIGAIILSVTERERYIRSIERSLVRDRDPDTRLVLVDPAIRAGTEPLKMGWLRILRGEWRALEGPERPARADARVVRPLLAAAARGDRDEALRVAQEVADDCGDGPPSVFVAAMERHLPGRSSGRPVVRADRSAGLFIVGADATGEPAVRYASAPLRAVESHGRATGEQLHAAGPASALFVVERLECGHRRAERIGDWGPAVRRRCRPCASAGGRR